MGRRRGELFFQVSREVLRPISEPNLEGREGQEFLEKEKEGSEGVFSDPDPDIRGPGSGLGIERPDGLLRQEGNQGLGLTASICPVS